MKYALFGYVHEKEMGKRNISNELSWTELWSRRKVFFGNCFFAHSSSEARCFYGNLVQFSCQKEKILRHHRRLNKTCNILQHKKRVKKRRNINFNNSREREREVFEVYISCDSRLLFKPRLLPGFFSAVWIQTEFCCEHDMPSCGTWKEERKEGMLN